MATRDQMISDALKEVKEGLNALGQKLDNRMDGYTKDMTDFKVKYAEEMAVLRTQVKIYAAIAGVVGAGVGTAVTAAVMKLVLVR